MSQAVTNFKNTRENLTDAWKFYGEGTHMLNFGTKVLQSYGRYSVPLRDVGELNSCASIRTLTWKNFWNE